jgi:hypothetical protein
MVLEQAGRKVWRLAQRFVGPVLRARWLPLVIVAALALVSPTFPFLQPLPSHSAQRLFIPMRAPSLTALPQISSNFSIPAALDSSAAAHNGRQLPQVTHNPHQFKNTRVLCLMLHALPPPHASCRLTFASARHAADALWSNNRHRLRSARPSRSRLRLQSQPTSVWNLLLSSLQGWGRRLELPCAL